MAEQIDSQLVAQVRSRIVKALEARGWTIVDLTDRVGISEGGFHSRFREGSLQLRTLEAMAKALDLPVGALLPNSQLPEEAAVVAEPQATYGKPQYLEQRVERLEVELRKLKEQLRPR